MASIVMMKRAAESSCKRLSSLLNKRQDRLASTTTITSSIRRATEKAKNQRNQLVQERKCGLLAAVDNIWTSNGNVEESKSECDLLSSTSTTILEHATSKLRHRGPDGRQVAMGTLGGGGGRWAMGHQRLAIVDPESHLADMPFVLQFGNKKVSLVANGEIYNHEKLYNKLTATPYNWPHARRSGSDCEVIAHACSHMGPEEAVKHLDGMFAFCITIDSEDGSSPPTLFAARDPVGIKPLYYGKSLDEKAFVFASELKALVGHVSPSTVKALPPGHYWTPQTGPVRYHKPEWLFQDSFEPWKTQIRTPEEEKAELHQAFVDAVQKRMMADVEYGFFLSGGVDSCVVSHALLPLLDPDQPPIPAFTVGMEDSPDLMAAKAMVSALNDTPTKKSAKVDHRPRIFTAKEVMQLIPKIIYHMETYEAELIRSAIPNWLLAERAGADVKMVLTGEGADELFAGYLYFMDAPTPNHVQQELKRIYQKLGDINLHRTDRMTMAHALEARVPFLDTEFTRKAMSIDPTQKVVDSQAVARNAPGREKTYLRQMFGAPNDSGVSIPSPVLWRAKAMQCEGVGEDWVKTLQRHVASQISDAEFQQASTLYPLSTPQTKEEFYYRQLFEDFFPNMGHVVNPWEGGCRAAGAAWDSASYTREGLTNTSMLTHAFQEKSSSSATSLNARAAFSTMASSAVGSASRRSMSTQPSSSSSSVSKRSFFWNASTATKESSPPEYMEEFMDNASGAGFDEFESALTVGGDDRNLINPASGTNKYHCVPRPVSEDSVFRGSCTCNAPTRLGYDKAQTLYEEKFAGEYWNDEDKRKALQSVFDDQRARIAKALELPEGVQVVLCPSGSDAEYLPVAMARVLQKDKSKPIFNVVTQLREIGAGSSVASGGEYFSTHAPLLGKLPSDTGRMIGFDESVVTEYSIPARERDGSVVDAVAKANESAEKAQAEGKYVIRHGVFGGKTGLCDEDMPGSTDGGTTSMGIVDACQGRFSLKELHEWLEQDSVILFTGSKFFQAPPFCGAIFIPQSMAEKIATSAPPPADMMEGLSGFWTDLELPDCMNGWKPALAKSNKMNVGLALRWEAGLAGMEALSSVSDADRTKAVDSWAQQVTDLVASEEFLDPWCVQRSIISIRVKKSSNDDAWRSMQELRDVYRYLSKDVSGAVPEATPEEARVLSTCCSLGQPVDVADSHAILRIALGAESLANYLDNPEATLEEDKIAVQKLATIAKYFDKLQEAKDI